MGEVRGRLQEEEEWVELRDRGWEETLKLGETQGGCGGFRLASQLKLNQGIDTLFSIYFLKEE